MKLRAAVVCGAVVALAVPTMASATPSSGSKVTGGGQSLTDGKDTIGFNARPTGEDTADGQVQYVDRAADGSTQTQYHGDVTCYTQIGDNAAYIAGTWRNVNGDTPEDGTEFFKLYVEDNGEPNRGIDMIMMDTAAPDPTCAEDDAPDDDEQIALARGNVQFHAAKSSRRKKSKKRVTAPKTSTTTNAITFGGLRL